MGTRFGAFEATAVGSRARRWRSGRGWTAAVIAAALVGSLLTATPVRAEPPTPPGLQPQVEKLGRDGVSVAGLGWPRKPQPRVTPPAPVWPAAGTARAVLPVAGQQRMAAGRAGALPVSVARTPGVAADKLSEVSVEVLDRAAVPAAWKDGVVLRVGAPAERSAPGNATVSISYAAFRHAYGANWASRLRLWQLPPCALSDTGQDDCRATQLRSTNDAGAGVVSAAVSVPPVAAAAAAGGARAAAAPAGGLVLALAAGSSGPSGDFAATPLSPSSTWSAGGSSGAFSWSYPMRAPGLLVGPQPQLALSYSSSSVDGRSQATNNQPSWVGQGFDMASNFIERRYVPCKEDDEGRANNPRQTGDMCWRSHNATMSLNGGGSDLIAVPGSDNKRWRSRTDDGSVIERRTGANNGDDDGEHWVVTTTDGTQYFFGLHNLPGHSDDTGSAWTVPVYGNHANEPCHKDGFAASRCAQAWRWNLDYVKDVSGNTMSYWYDRELNQYATRVTDDEPVPYVRAGTLKRIDYGTWDRLRDDNTTDRSVAPGAQILFETADRCTSDCGKHDETHWPDVAWDQECATNAKTCPGLYSPTFWSTKRLKKVTTRVWDTSKAPAAMQNVDSWTLDHDFPSSADGTDAGLWLRSIVRAGEVGQTKALPPVTFEPVAKPNRVLTRTNTTNNWQRLAEIKSETGALTTVRYSLPECTSATHTPDTAANTNTSLCYPVIGRDPYDPDVKYFTEWWHKYVVLQVTEVDVQLEGQRQTPPRNTYYDYDRAGPAWHYSDYDTLSEPKRRTWDQFRGYASVSTRVGDTEQTLTKTSYFRGMHGDRKSKAGGTRAVTVPASLGTENVRDEEAFAGMTREHVVYNGTTDKPLTKTVNVPWQSEPTATRTTDGHTVAARFAGVTTKYQATALGVNGERGWRTTRTRTHFNDDYGTTDWSSDDGDISVGDDEKCVTYHYNRNTRKNIVTLPKRVTTTALPCGKPAVSADDVISDAQTAYDGATSVDVAPTRGLTTRMERLKNWTPGGGTEHQLVGETTYDAAGRVSTSKDIRGNVTRTDYVPAGRGPVSKVTATNANKWTTITDVAPYWGQATKTTDANQRVTQVSYDALGRTSAVWNVGWSYAGHENRPSVRYSYEYSRDRTTYPYVKTEALHAQGRYRTSYQIFDAFLRPRQTQSDGVTAGERVISDTIYDHWGRAHATYAAHAEAGDASGTLFWKPEWSHRAVTRTVFDRAGRPRVTTELGTDGATNLVELSHTTTDYAGDQTMVTPPTGATPTTSVTDTAGRVVQLHQHTTTDGLRGPADTTTYTYNRKDQLAKVTDPAGNQWSYTYDLKGLQRQARDPDKGVTTSDYNDNDDLIKTTSGDEVLAYSYDNIGRKTGLYDDTVSPATKRAEWVYDRLPDGTPLRGHLVRTTRYDQNRNAYSKQVNTVNERYQPLVVNYVMPNGDMTFGSYWSYEFRYSDYDGSPTAMKLPGVTPMPQETLTTRYDDHSGLPVGLDTLDSTYVARQDYTSYGEPRVTVRRTGSGQAIDETVSYDTATRRTKLVQTKPDSATGTVKNQSYEYDPAGNILSIADKPQVGPGETQCFRYDGLRRLSSAWTPEPELDCQQNPNVGKLGGTAPYWTDWTFDKAGNRKQEISRTPAAETTRTYTVPPSGPNAVRPHAVTSVSTQITGQPTATDASYQYDDTGNMTQRPGPTGTEQTLKWDAEGRSAEILEGTTRTTNLYDADGARLIRRDANGATLYLPGMEIRRDTTTTPATLSGTRYYSFAGRTVASRTSIDQKLTWLFDDHQGTQQLSIEDTNQKVTTRRQTPYGGPRGEQPAWANPKGFVGGDLDPSGLTHLGAREYDPGLGRFISVDPIMNLADPQQWNGYAYANNSPITQSDPTGLLNTCGDVAGKCDDTPAAPSTGGGPPPGQPPGGGGTPVHVAPAKKTSCGFWCATGKNVGGFFKGFGEQGVETIVGAAEIFVQDPDCLMAGTGVMAIWKCGPAVEQGFSNLADPLGAAKELWSAISNPIKDDWNNGNETEAVGRGVFMVVEVVLGSKGAGAAAKAGEAAAATSKVASAGGKARNIATSCLHSFAAGTLVLLANGTTRAIDQLQIGDLVLATDPITGETTAKPVTELHRNDDWDLTWLTVAGPRSPSAVLKTTWHHPFWSATRHKWVDAAHLRARETLKTSNGSTISVTAVDNRIGSRTMYDVTIADIHTYYVMAGTTPVLVHNCGESIYEAGGKHGPTARSSSRGTNSAEPRNGQGALDNSFEWTPEGPGQAPRRIGVSDGEIVILDRTRQAPCGCSADGGVNDIWHGHVRSWDELSPGMQSGARKAGLVDRKGRPL